MRSIIPIFVLAIYSIAIHGQNVSTSDSTTLKEVVVSAKHHVRQDISGDIYTPSMRIKENASDGLQLLSMLNYPGLGVDLVQKSISYTSSGDVQIRINHVVSSVEDLLSQQPSNIKNVRFVTMPGQKYGKDISLVIDVATKRADRGYEAGLSTMDAVNANYHDESLWAHKTNKNSELGVRYNFKANSNSKVYTDTRHRYTGSVTNTLDISRNGKYSNSEFTSHDVELGYNYAPESENLVFDVKAGMNFSGFPQRRLTENISYDNTHTISETYNKSRSLTPFIKIYLNRSLDSLSTISAYLTSAYLRNRYTRGYTVESLDNVYRVRGAKYSMHGEIAYGRDLARNSNLTAGFQYDASSTKNEYQRTNAMDYTMHEDQQLWFVEYALRLSQFQFQASAGLSRSHNSMSQSSYTYVTFKPELSLLYKFTDWLSASYKSERSPELPSLADMTDFKRQDDLWETTAGNPLLKPYGLNSNEMKISADLGDTYLSLRGNFDITNNSIFLLPPTWDAASQYYLITKENGGRYRHLQVSLYGEQYLFSRKLFIYAMPYMIHDISKTDVYSLSNTMFSVKAGLSVYLKRLTFDFDYDSPSETLTGETVFRNLGTTNLCATYRMKSLSLKLGIRNAFNHKGSGNVEERLSANAYKRTEIRNHAFGNMVYFSLTWNFLRSSKKRNTQKNVITSDPSLDDGIVK